MDISNDDDKEPCRSTKKAKTSDDSKDFISDLPDPILAHILSFLPIEDAINTVLLRRFGNLWRSIKVLNLNSCMYHDCEDDDYLPDYLNENFVDVIRHVLNLHDSSTLDKLCLKFGFALTYSKDESLFNGSEDHVEWEKGTADQIEKLIRYAIRKKVKVLDLNLKGCILVDPREFFDLPDVLSSNYLTDLRLAACEIRSCTTIDLKSLRFLLLDEVSLSNDIMEEVLLGCPFLENLSLVDCYDLGKLNCKNPNLKKVMLTLNVEDQPFFISCPYVLSLEIYGWIERACLLDVSSVVDASIFFSYLFRCEQRKYGDVRRLLQKVSQCKTFSPCTWSILVLTIWNFRNVPCTSFEWKNLILKLSLTKWHHPGLSLLLRNSQSLETVTMYIYPGWADIFKREEAKWIQAYDFDGENYWDLQEATFSCLESIMIYGYVNEPYVIQMVKFLLKSATRLQKLVISTKSFSNRPVKAGSLGVQLKDTNLHQCNFKNSRKSLHHFLEPPLKQGYISHEILTWISVLLSNGILIFASNSILIVKNII